MRRTLNEVYRICQKAAEGAGVPPGLDIDAAQNAVWLTAHGFAALDTLAGELAHAGSRDACRFSAADTVSETLNASGKAGALLAPALVDLLIARAEGRTGQLTMTDLSAPLYLLPASVRHTHAGWYFHFELSSPGNERFVLNVDPDGASILGTAAEDATRLMGDGGFQVTGHCARARDALPSGAAQLRVLVDSDTLAETGARSQADGTEIEPKLWDRLQTFAVNVLVPATAESRSRGAGSETNDNE